MREFKLPDVGEGLTEAEIVGWRVKTGDTVKVNDIIVEIETAKSLVELPCPFAGTVAGLLVGEGQTVEVGTPIIAVATGDGSAASGYGAPAATPATAGEDVAQAPEEGAVEPGLIGGPAPGGRTSVLVGYGPRTTEAKRRPRKGDAVPSEPAPAAAQQNVQTAFSTGEEQAPEVPVEEAEPAAPSIPRKDSDVPGVAAVRVLAKPPVRKLAKDLGIDLLDVAPSGPGGVVTRADVEAHVAVGAPVAATSDAAGERVDRETRIPVKGVRKMTAQAMVVSAFTAPHVTEWVTVDVTRTVKFVQRLKEHRDFTAVRVSPLLVVAKAVCLAAGRTPEVNATWDDAAQEIVLKHYVNLGIAAATPRGLVVPNIKGADAMTLHQLATALGELTSVARDGRTQPAEMAGGTFTITNVGVFGVDAGTPILNPGETGILCFGAIRKQPWVVGNRIRPRSLTTLALSFDHRVVDGAAGSRFLADVAAILEDPGAALLF
ncbi:MAG: dihydrolipoamide acetyltransferase family protein [Nocardioidaceae bacterium]